MVGVRGSVPSTLIVEVGVMQRSTLASTTRGLTRALHGALSLLLALTAVAWVGTAPASAVTSGWINVQTGLLETFVSGQDWNLDDHVAVSVDGALASTADVNAMNQFRVDLPTPPAVGVAVRAVGQESGTVKEVVVPPLTITEWDVPGGQVLGTGGQAPWSAVEVNLGNQFTPPSPPTSASVGADSTWSADVGVAAFDLRAHLGTAVHQIDSDGDFVSYGAPVPNPVVDVWDSHGVALHGWTPGSTVTITLSNPADGSSFSWAVEVDQDGEYWDVPPESPWDVVMPGWTASATGPVLGRESDTITKSIVVPDPFPFPEIDSFKVSDTIAGTLTNTTIGAGSIVNVSPACDGANVNREIETDGAGYFEVFVNEDPPPYGGGFGTCSSEPVSLGYDVMDLDGDHFGANWQVTPEPAVTAAGPLWDGQELTVEGTGFDLMAVRLLQCELVDGVPGRCDPSTEKLVNPYPGENWPADGAQFQEYQYVAKQFLELDGDVVDCGVAPESCAVVVTEPQREGVVGWAPLTYYRVIDLQVTASARGTVSTVTGNATVSGTVSASEPTWVHLSGELRQRFGRTRVVVGGFDSWVYVEEAGVATSWTLKVTPATGQAFGSGFAELTVNADLGDEGPSWAGTTVTVKLNAPKPKR